ncbi:hypothetical protein LCGC14_0687010 [marine sediment metagenome]|uniref:Uncharacterized protein n=1 Tax=marine sediment metagenome TaxID=412755 RepID=A0A0F9QRB9_9ZZZZ
MGDEALKIVILDVDRALFAAMFGDENIAQNRALINKVLISV